MIICDGPCYVLQTKFRQPETIFEGFARSKLQQCALQIFVETPRVFSYKYNRPIKLNKFKRMEDWPYVWVQFCHLFPSWLIKHHTLLGVTEAHEIDGADLCVQGKQMQVHGAGKLGLHRSENDQVQIKIQSVSADRVLVPFRPNDVVPTFCGNRSQLDTHSPTGTHEATDETIWDDHHSEKSDQCLGDPYQKHKRLVFWQTLTQTKPFPNSSLCSVSLCLHVFTVFTVFTGLTWQRARDLDGRCWCGCCCPVGWSKCPSVCHQRRCNNKIDRTVARPKLCRPSRRVEVPRIWVLTKQNVRWVLPEIEVWHPQAVSMFCQKLQVLHIRNIQPGIRPLLSQYHVHVQLHFCLVHCHGLYQKAHPHFCGAFW